MDDSIILPVIPPDLRPRQSWMVGCLLIWTNDFTAAEAAHENEPKTRA